MIVTEKAAPRVKVYDPAGELVAVIADAVFDADAKNMDVAVDATGRIYVVDTVKLQIFVFAPAAHGGRGMSQEHSRREVLGHAARGAALAGLGGSPGSCG